MEQEYLLRNLPIGLSNYMVNQVAAPLKEPFLFKPAGRALLLGLAVVSAGYFLAPLIASTRRASKTGQYLFTLILGVWIVSHFHMGAQGAVTFGVVLTLMSLFTRQIVPPAVETSVEHQLQTQVDPNATFTLPEADGSGNAVTYLIKAKSQVEALQKAQLARRDGLSTFYSDMQSFHDNYPELELSDDSDAEITIFTVENCDLFEPRKGPTVTQRETTSGGRPFVGTKVGPLFVGGSGRSTSHSTSVSTPAEDIVQVVDTGNLVVTSRSVSFVGGKYTRHSDFKSLIAVQGEDSHMTFADSKKTTIWGISFNDRVDMWIVNALVGAADDLSDRRLDTSGKATAEDLKHALTKAADETNTMLREFYLSAYEQFNAVNAQLREYHRVFPNQVTDPGPSQKPANLGEISTAN